MAGYRCFRIVVGEYTEFDVDLLLPVTAGAGCFFEGAGA